MFYLDEVTSIRAPLLSHLAEEEEFIGKEAQATIRAAFASKNNIDLVSYPGRNHAFAL